MSDTFWTALMASIPAALTAIGSLIATVRAAKVSKDSRVTLGNKIDGVQEGINGQLTRWKTEVLADMERRIAAALAQGIVQGEENERERAKIRIEDRIREANAAKK